jgi:hypothetical protein
VNADQTKYPQRCFEASSMFKIQSLEISGDTKFHSTTLSAVLSEIIATSKLAEITLVKLDPNEKNMLDLLTLLGPLAEDSTLKRLTLGNIESPGSAQELFSIIPRLRGLNKYVLGLLVMLLLRFLSCR